MSKAKNDTEMLLKLEGKSAHGDLATEAAAVVSGAAIGALAGAVACPVGVAAGAVIGGAAGAIAGVAIARSHGNEDADQRNIDAIESQAEAEIVERRSSLPPPPARKAKTWEQEVEESLEDHTPKGKVPLV